jgi:universal stress protein E
MNAIRNILVIVDPASTDQSALAKGALLAEKFGARLEVADGPVKQTDADLIVKDTHHHTFARRTVFTNSDWELIRGLSAALLLTKPTAWSRVPNILAAVESDRDSGILDHAEQLAQRLDGRLHVVHAYPCKVPVVAPIMPGPILSASIAPEALAAEHTAKLKVLSRLTDRYSLPLENLHLEMGGVRGSICKVASQIHADVVAMGTMSRNGLARAFIGNTVEEVIERLPCDALIVKS